MSEQSKQDMNTIKERFKKVGEDAGSYSEFTKKLDGGLSEKIRRVKESSQEVVKHIEERLGGPKGA